MFAVPAAAIVLAGCYWSGLGYCNLMIGAAELAIGMSFVELIAEDWFGSGCFEIVPVAIGYFDLAEAVIVEIDLSVVVEECFGPFVPALAVEVVAADMFAVKTVLADTAVLVELTGLDKTVPGAAKTAADFAISDNLELGLRVPGKVVLVALAVPAATDCSVLGKSAPAGPDDFGCWRAG